GNQYTLKEHDSVRINTERNVYYRHATEHGGSVIVTEIFKRKTLHGDIKHNCVFVGCNEKRSN
ncbi:MAG: hypothetical protein ACERKO_04325, partial [Acetanaerobacterium sp.]